MAKRRLSFDAIKRMFGGHKKPSSGNDNFDISSLEAQIDFMKKDILASDQWIYNYEQDLKKFANIPKIAAHIQEMIAAEQEGKKKAQERLDYLLIELDEEKAKGK